MAWPYSGNWNGLNVTQLPEIMAALAKACNERLSVLNTSYGTLPTFTTVNGQKTYPTASDFYGMEINGELMDAFTTEIDTRIRSLLGRNTFNANNVYFASFYSGTTLFPQSVSSASDILPADIKPTALCSNFWLRLKDVCDGATLFKVFLRNPTTTISTTNSSDAYAGPDTAWANIGDNSTSGWFARALSWVTEDTGNIQNPTYTARLQDDRSYTYSGTSVLAGSVTDGRIFPESEVANVAVTQNIDTSLKEEIDVNIAGKSFTVGIANGTTGYSIEYTGWNLGSSTNFDFDFNLTPTESPFVGSVTREDSFTEETATWNNIGELRLSFRRLSNSSTSIDYNFSSINPFLVLDISSLLTDQL